MIAEKICWLEPHGTLALLRIPGSDRVSRSGLLEVLQRQLDQLAARDGVRAVLICGLNGRFCRSAPEAGLTPSAAARLARLGQDALSMLETLGKPVVAALSGEITGLGLELALACSFTVADPAASFGFPDISRGQLPCCGGTQRLARQVGRSMAKQLLFSGDLITAEEALRVRLVNRLYPQDRLETEALSLLERIATRSPLALRVGGEVVDAGYDIDLRTACLLERNAFALCFATHDQKEGMGSFLEKRDPHFTGA